jgi:hypothetical protein
MQLTNTRYWWDQNLGPDTPEETYQYNLKTYGPDHVYDDFIQNFTASAWDPKEWVDLFADAGANYFVQVSKHHDGYAIFDLPANVSQRTSVAQFPHRNLLQASDAFIDWYQKTALTSHIRNSLTPLLSTSLSCIVPHISPSRNGSIPHTPSMASDLGLEETQQTRTLTQAFHTLDLFR